MVCWDKLSRSPWFCAAWLYWILFVANLISLAHCIMLSCSFCQPEKIEILPFLTFVRAAFNLLQFTTAFEKCIGSSYNNVCEKEDCKLGKFTGVQWILIWRPKCMFFLSNFSLWLWALGCFINVSHINIYKQEISVSIPQTRNLWWNFPSRRPLAFCWSFNSVMSEVLSIFVVIPTSISERYLNVSIIFMKYRWYLLFLQFCFCTSSDCW